MLCITYPHCNCIDLAQNKKKTAQFWKRNYNSYHLIEFFTITNENNDNGTLLHLVYIIFSVCYLPF